MPWKTCCLVFPQITLAVRFFLHMKETPQKLKGGDLRLQLGPQCIFEKFLIIWFENHQPFLVCLIFQVFTWNLFTHSLIKNFVGNLSSARLEPGTILQRWSPPSWLWQSSGGLNDLSSCMRKLNQSPTQNSGPRTLVPITVLSPRCQELTFVWSKALGTECICTKSHLHTVKWSLSIPSQL